MTDFFDEGYFSQVSEPNREATNQPVLFEGNRLSNMPAEEGQPWWSQIGCHRLHDCLELIQEAEQVAVLYMPHNSQVHFCVQYHLTGSTQPPWRSCRVMSIQEYVGTYDNSAAQMELAQSEINFLKTMYEPRAPVQE